MPIETGSPGVPSLKYALQSLRFPVRKSRPDTTPNDRQQKARSLDRAFDCLALRGERGLRRFVRDGGIIAIGVDVSFGVRAGLRLGLGAAARALGELAFDFLDRLGFRDMLHDGDFPRQAVERRFI